jgi:hypothetical protein
MATGSFQLPQEIQEALIRLLIGCALPSGKSESLTILTTAPGQWIPYSSSLEGIIVDLGNVFSGTIWSSETELKDRFIAKLQSAGWSNERIALDTRLAKTGGRARYTRTDFLLLDDERKPLAVIEMKKGVVDWTDVLTQTKLYADDIGAAYAFVWDGVELRSSNGPVDGVPSPVQLGLSPPARSESGATANSKVAILRFDTLESFLESFKKLLSGIVIVDYTIPWGYRSNRIAKAIEACLPREGLPLKPLEPLDVLLLLASIPASRLVAFVPAVVLITEKSAPLRGAVSFRLRLNGVVELPSQVLTPIASIRTAVAVLDATKQSDYTVTFANPASRGDIIDVETQSWFHDFKTALATGKNASMFQADVKDDEPWSSYAHRPRQKVEKLLKGFSETLPLGDLCDIIAGLRHSREEAKPNRGIQIVRGLDLSSDPISRDQLTWVKSEGALADKLKLSRNDIIIQRIGPQPKSSVVTPELEGVFASDTVFILRPRSEQTDSGLIAQFLRSFTGQALLQAASMAAFTPTLSASALRSLPIPIVSEEISAELARLEETERDLRLRADRLAAMRLNVFDIDSPQDLRDRLDKIRKDARALDASIRLAETLDFQIRNFFPFPLAFAYRTLTGFISPQETYVEQFRVAENLLAFVASIELSLIAGDKERLRTIDIVKAWQGGISPGTWRDVSIHAARVLSDYKTDLAAGVRALWLEKRKGKFREAVDRLISTRNDFHHGRGPKTEEDLAKAVDETSGLFCLVYGDLAFLTEYPIRLVREIDAIRGTTRVILQTLRLAGDHPGLMQEKLEYATPLKRNDLYIELQSGIWEPLYPFLSVHSCPTCKIRETYFVDAWAGPGKGAKLKSFERGHTIENKDIGEALKHLVT